MVQTFENFITNMTKHVRNDMDMDELNIKVLNLINNFLKNYYVWYYQNSKTPTMPVPPKLENYNYYNLKSSDYIITRGRFKVIRFTKDTIKVYILSNLFKEKPEILLDDDEEVKKKKLKKLLEKIKKNLKISKK